MVVLCQDVEGRGVGEVILTAYNDSVYTQEEDDSQYNTSPLFNLLSLTYKRSL